MILNYIYILEVQCPVRTKQLFFMLFSNFDPEKSDD